MKIIKSLYRLICVFSLIVLILSFQNSSVTDSSKTSNENLNKTVNLNAMAKVIQNFQYADLNFPLDTYNGTLTGYVADCPLCTGYLACNNQNVLDKTTTYIDKQYGEVRIVASSRNLPCGTIVRFKNNTISNSGELTAIVLDRGVTGTSLDLLVESVDVALTQVGSKKINYDILRFGWTRTES